MEIKKLFKEEKPSELLAQAVKEKMEEASIEKLEAFCLENNINYETLSRLKSNVDELFEFFDLCAFRRSKIQKIINFIKGIESFVE